MIVQQEKIDNLKKAIRNPEKTKILLRWMLDQVWPFKTGLIMIFLINVLSIMISYGSTIIGKYIVDDATTGVINFHNMSLMCLTTAVSILIGIGSNIFNSYISEKFSFGIRAKVFSNIQHSAWKQITKIHSGDILTRMTSDISTISDGLISILPNALLIGVQLVLAFGILCYYDKTMALISIIIGPFGAIAAWMFRRKYWQYQTALRESESEYRSFIQECISNLVVMKTFQQEDLNDQRIEQLRKKRIDIIFKNSQLSALMGALFRLIYNVGYVVAFCWGAYRISTGVITYGTLTIFISLVSRIQGTITNLASIVPQTYNVLISSKRVYDITEMEKEVYAGLEDVPVSVGLEAEHVDFGYNKNLVLQDINLSVNAGEKIGIIGESGAGKTTFIRMLLALTKPNKGSLKYTFEDVQKEKVCPDSRRFIAYVPQGNTLISGTIADNLRVGKADATEEEMWKALKLADAERFLRKIPEQLELEISEKAGGLSEGQAQRIAIARALISRKPVMILDEATSALDENTEAVVLENIAENYKDTTCFIITHRRSMLQYCDRVIEIGEDGRIVFVER